MMSRNLRFVSFRQRLREAPYSIGGYACGLAAAQRHHPGGKLRTIKDQTDIAGIRERSKLAQEAMWPKYRGANRRNRPAAA
jgi:hypothetical protein